MEELDLYKEIEQDVTWDNDDLSDRSDLENSELDVYSTELEDLI
jgi:hypothetical protein